MKYGSPAVHSPENTVKTWPAISAGQQAAFLVTHGAQKAQSWPKEMPQRLQDPLVNVSAGAQGGEQFRNVIRTTGFHGDVDRRVTEAHPVVGAVVGSLDDVGAVLGEDSGEAMKRAGIIGQVNAQAHQAAIFDETALHDSREQADVDVSAADQRHDSLADQGRLAIDERSDGGGTRAFG